MKKLIFITVCLMIFNLVTLTIVVIYKNRSLRLVKENQFQLATSLKKVDDNYQQILTYHSTVSKFTNSKLETLNRIKLFSANALYTRYYYDQNTYNVPYKWSSCQTSISINNIEVWFLTNRIDIFNSTNTDTILVCARIAYNYKCKTLQKDDTYTVWRYQLPNHSKSIYDNIDDTERVYISIDAEEVIIDKKRICRIRFFDITKDDNPLFIADTILNTKAEEFRRKHYSKKH